MNRAAVGLAKLRGAALCTAFALALGLTGCGNSPAQRLEKARALVAKNDRLAALIQIKSVIQEQPTLGEARLLLGTVLLDGGDPVAAEIELRRALELGQAESQVVPVLARALLATGQTAKLVAQFGALSWSDGAVTASLKALVAEAEATQGDLAAARISLGQALHALPGHEPSLRLQARVAAVAGDVPGALQQIEALLASQPDSAEAWLLKGDLLARQQADPAAVLAAYRQALVVRPDLAGAHAALIALHLAQRDNVAATAQWQAMHQRLPRHPQTLLYEGQLAFINGNLPRARELFQGLLRAAPDNLLLLQSAGAVELRLNAPVQAEVLLTKALQIAPEAAGTRRLLAQTFLSLGQPAKALTTLEPLTGPTRPDVEALTLAAQARQMAGQGDAAAALLGRAAQLKPDDPKIRTAVALSKLARAQAGPAGKGGHADAGEAALAELRAVAQSDTGSTADMALIAAHLRSQDYDAALKAIAALDRKQADRPLAAHLRGQVMLVQNNPPAARQAFEQALQRDPRFFPSVAGLARLDMRDNQPDAAKARFEALIKLDPQNTAAYQALAGLAARSGAGREAVAALLEQAIKANPAEVAPRLALIDHHLATYNPQAAAVAAQAGLAQLPDHIELLGRLGQAQLAAGAHQQALITYNRVLTLQPKSPLGLLGLANTQLAANDPAAAARSVQRVLALVPDHLPAQRLGIHAALRQKQPDAALAIARQVQQQRPGQAVGWLLEAEIALAQRRPEVAVPLLRTAISKAEPSPAPERLHDALRRSGKPAEADAFERSWLKDHPRDALFLFYLGDWALAQKDWAGAEQRYQAVLAVSPEHALSLNNIAWLLLEQKKPGARAYAERAVRAAPEQPALMDTLALTQAADNQPAQAIELQKRALVMRPDDPFLRLNLARFYAQAGEKRLAKAELDRLAALGERFPKQAEVAAQAKGLGGR